MATPSSSSYPALISAPRLTTLLASTLVSFASGSGYTYSAWAPQLGARLGLSHTQLNVISVAGNVGSHTTGFIWGKIVDSRGPRILLAGGAVSILSGYLGIWNFFVAGLSPTETSLPSFRFLALSACNYAIGVATIAGHMSSTNATAKTFPDRARATALGVVISALGLAAFVFSTVAQMLFPGDTSSLLLLLTFGTTLPMILGFFWVRPIPLPPSSNPDAVDRHDAVVFRYENASQAHLLLEGSTDPNESDQAVYEGGDVLELSSRRPCDSMGSGKEYHVEQPNIYGLRLCKTPEFWLLSAMFAMLSGTGLMYINNVGVMSQALYVHSRSVYDDKDAQKWQAVQVSIISVTSFAGRITIGLISDITKTRLQRPRSYCLALTSLALLTSQYVATRIDELESLWVASALVGLGYGSIFPLFSSMCIEWLGLPHFSENWGYATSSTILSSNLFSLVFGRNLDAHEPPSRRGLPAETSGRMCLEGKTCYVDALYLTMCACALSFSLSVYAAWRDQKKLRKLESWGWRRTSRT